MNVKSLLRKAVGAKKGETINDALIHKRIHIEKLFYRKRYSTDELKSAIRTCGVKAGDIIMVHCSWRNMYNYDGTPEDVIEILKNIVGDTGTILMPSYGSDRYSFDINNTPSNAGVLSEVFRKQSNVQRSACTHFSVAGWGKDSDEILCEHIKSHYGFDRYSPCYKLGSYTNSKVLFLGLGAEPTKISIFHCAGAHLKDKDEKLNELLSYIYESELIIQGIRYKKEMYIRKPGHKNNTAVFRKIFRSLVKKKCTKLSNLDIVLINAEEAINNSIAFAEKGEYCYKNMSVL